MAVRVAICGIHIESSTFTPQRSGAEDFQVLRGDALLQRYPWLTGRPIPGIDAVPPAQRTESGELVRPWAEAVEWVPVLHAAALPGGPVEPEAHDAWREEILAGLAQAGPLDGVFLDIHGAMSVPGRRDVEGELARAVREVVGPDALISASMDLHGNVSEALFGACDLLTCYRMAPHEDAWVSRERAARLLCQRLLDGAGAPHKALVHVPVLLAGEQTSTRVEPARSLYARLPEVCSRPGILDAGLWIGFAWADEPRCRAAVVVTGEDGGVVAGAARELAEEFWAVHDRFDFVGPTAGYDEALTTALRSDKRPFLLSDSGDNPGAGGAGDVTVTLAALLGRREITGDGYDRNGRDRSERDGSERDGEADGAAEAPVSALLASIVDPAAVAACTRAGQGRWVDLSLGGHLDPRAPGPVPVRARVARLATDPRGGDTAVVTVGGLFVIVTSRRNQYTTHEQFARLGLTVSDFDVVTVKIGYLEPDLFDVAADWLLCLTPGGVDQDIVRLGHRHITRPMYPFDADMDDPQVRVVTG